MYQSLNRRAATYFSRKQEIDKRNTEKLNKPYERNREAFDP